MKEREKEAEADARDRHKEKEELEELRKKLVEEGHPDPDSEINRRQNPSKAVVVIADSPEQAPPDMVTFMAAYLVTLHNTDVYWLNLNSDLKIKKLVYCLSDELKSKV